MTDNNTTLSGRCSCDTIRYRLEAKPMAVNCCHCTYCQRETGSAFVINAFIESSLSTILTPTPPLIVDTPSESGFGQQIARCPKCFVALWSCYGGTDFLAVLRVGTLENPDLCPPDFHIYTSTKQNWVVLPDGARAFEEQYDKNEHWSQESLERWEKLQPSIEVYQRVMQKQRTDLDESVREPAS